MKIALAGNPNSGKTTLFNGLTGSNQYVGNWPGVTVEKKEGQLLADKSITLTDLPGIYSLSPYTNEEIVARNYLINERPDVIINIVDATNLERNLYLTTQLREIGIPMVIALNMMDVVRKKGTFICLKSLEEAYGCPFVEISALKNEGFTDLLNKVYSVAGTKPQKRLIFDHHIEEHLNELENTLSVADFKRYYAVRLLENDAQLGINISAETKETAERVRKELEGIFDDDIESIFATERYDYIEKSMCTCHKCGVKKSFELDKILMNKYLALPIFGLVMFFVYYISVTTVGTIATDWVNDTLIGSIIIPGAQNLLASIGTADWLIALITDGVIGGVGAVLGFLPQLALLFFLLALLEDSGYMARIAFLLDKIFRKFGLSGKSFIPILIGTGCSVPGIMASRTIESESDRKMTVITTSFMPCSAKLPVIAMIAGAMFDGASWVAPSAYFIGIMAILVSGLLLKKTKPFKSEEAPFIMELPSYHIPKMSNVLKHTWERVRSFAVKAGTVIFLACIVIWLLSNFNFAFEMVDSADSMLADIGGVIAPVFKPLGFGTWEAAVATLTGLAAKENIVGTFGVLYGAAEVAEDGMEVWANLQQAFTPLSAYCFLMFNLLCAPCIGALGAIKREIGKGKIALFALTYQTIFAYIVTFIVYNVGKVLF